MSMEIVRIGSGAVTILVVAAVLTTFIFCWRDDLSYPQGFLHLDHRYGSDLYSRSGFEPRMG